MSLSSKEIEARCKALGQEISHYITGQYTAQETREGVDLCYWLLGEYHADNEKTNKAIRDYARTTKPG